jgi:hypothetical protein
MIEEVVRFGADPRLLGIVTRPPRSDAAGTDLGLLFLSAGLLHRVGPHRLHVTLAREVAARGGTSMRFDAAGVGDSPVRLRSGGAHPEGVTDVVEAMDFLGGHYGLRRFLLAGLCSGAGRALQTAALDPRVAGVAALEGWAYPTPRYHMLRSRYLFERYGARFLGPESWERVRGKAGTLLERLHPGPDGEPDDEDAPPQPEGMPPHDEAVVIMREIARRGVRVLACFTGKARRYYNYAEQFEDNFADAGLGALAKVRFWPDADHTFMDVQAREELSREILAFRESLLTPAGAG